MENQKKTALITGGTSGIGLELAKLFAKDGYNLIIVARNQQELDNTANQLSSAHGIDVKTISKDLFERQASFDVYDQVKQMGVQVDVLVNDAGQGVYGLFAETDINRELDIVQLNIGALTTLTKCFLKEMLQRNDGKILNLGSIAGKVPGPYQSVYHGTKAFVLSFTEAVRNEIKDSNVTITALMPGATDTDFFHKADMENAKIVQEGKLGDPADVAADGYKALMAGDGRIVSGTQNKFQVGMSNLMPDSVSADNMRKQQEPVTNDHK